MPQAEKGALSPAEVAEALESMPDWKVSGDAITRAYKCESFPAAIALVNKVAGTAQEMDHHPDMLIEFSKVTFRLTSHDSGGVTKRDLKLAKAIDSAFATAED